MIENFYIAMACFALAAIVVIIPAPASGSGKFKKASEREFQVAHHQGKMEHVLSDGSRVDDLTASHAIEYDFAKKWAEAVGQSLHYARLTGLKPGIVLILESESDIEKVQNITKLNLKITVWTVRNLKDKPILVKR